MWLGYIWGAIAWVVNECEILELLQKCESRCVGVYM